jgi:hypothetical protein
LFLSPNNTLLFPLTSKSDVCNFQIESVLSKNGGSIEQELSPLKLILEPETVKMPTILLTKESEKNILTNKIIPIEISFKLVAIGKRNGYYFIY